MKFPAQCTAYARGSEKCTLPGDHVQHGIVWHTPSNLVAHAYRELMIIGEDPEVVKGLLSAVSAFAGMGHSGGSAWICAQVLTKLITYDNLSPLTDDPEEWTYHSPEIWGEPNGIWQSQRKSSAFSIDNGVTYYLLSELGDARIFHASQPHMPPDEPKEEGGDENGGVPDRAATTAHGERVREPGESC